MNFNSNFGESYQSQQFEQYSIQLGFSNSNSGLPNFSIIQAINEKIQQQQYQKLFFQLIEFKLSALQQSKLKENELFLDISKQQKAEIDQQLQKIQSTLNDILIQNPQVMSIAGNYSVIKNQISIIINSLVCLDGIYSSIFKQIPEFANFSLKINLQPLTIIDQQASYLQNKINQYPNLKKISNNFNIELALIFWANFLSEYQSTTFNIFFKAFQQFVSAYFAEEIILTSKIVDKIKYIMNSDDQSIDSEKVLLFFKQFWVFIYKNSYTPNYFETFYFQQYESDIEDYEITNRNFFENSTNGTNEEIKQQQQQQQQNFMLSQQPQQQSTQQQQIGFQNTGGNNFQSQNTNTFPLINLQSLQSSNQGNSQVSKNIIPNLASQQSNIPSNQFQINQQNYLPNQQQSNINSQDQSTLPKPQQQQQQQQLNQFETYKKQIIYPSNQSKEQQNQFSPSQSQKNINNQDQNTLLRQNLLIQQQPQQQINQFDTYNKQNLQFSTKQQQQQQQFSMNQQNQFSPSQPNNQDQNTLLRQNLLIQQQPQQINQFDTLNKQNIQFPSNQSQQQQFSMNQQNQFSPSQSQKNISNQDQNTLLKQNLLIQQQPQQPQQQQQQNQFNTQKILSNQSQSQQQQQFQMQNQLNQISVTHQQQPHSKLFLQVMQVDVKTLFTVSEMIEIDPIKGYFNQKNQNSQKTDKIVQFGRQKNQNLPIVNDILFHPYDTNISGNQFQIVYNENKKKFRITCRSGSNPTCFKINDSGYELHKDSLFIVGENLGNNRFMVGKIEFYIQQSQIPEEIKNKQQLKHFREQNKQYNNVLGSKITLFDQNENRDFSFDTYQIQNNSFSIGQMGDHIINDTTLAPQHCCLQWDQNNLSWKLKEIVKTKAGSYLSLKTANQDLYYNNSDSFALKQNMIIAAGNTEFKVILS